MNNIIYQIKPFEIITYLLRIVSMFILFLLAYNFEVNPFAFSFFAIVPISVLLFSRTSKLTITKKFILIEHKNIIKGMSNIKKIFIDDIENIKYIKGNERSAKHLLPFSLGIPTEFTKIEISLKNKKNTTIFKIGTYEQFAIAIKTLNKLIE